MHRPCTYIIWMDAHRFNSMPTKQRGWTKAQKGKRNKNMLFKPYFTRLSQTIGTWLDCYCFSWSFFLFCRFMGCCCCFCGLGWSCGRHPVARGSRLQSMSMAKAQDLAPSPSAKAATPGPAPSFCRPLSSLFTLLCLPRSS